MNYQETGNKIPVTEDELLKVMNQKYIDYYNNQTTSSNPDTQDIIYTTQDGKTIKIPDEIKIKAKTIWLKSLMESEPSKKINKTKKSTNFINMIILFIAALIALYLIYIYTTDLRKSYNTGIDILKK